MVRGVSPAIYHCNLCGSEVPYGERRAHNRDTHPDIFEKQERALRRSMLMGLPVFVSSGVGLFLAFFVPLAILRVHLPDWYWVVVLVAFFASVAAPLPIAVKVRRDYFEPYGSMVIPCPVCDARIMEPNLWSHLSSAHPAEYRYLRPTRWVVYGSELGIIVLFLLGRFAPVMYAVVGVWIALFILWVVVVHRWRGKARSNWHSTHFEAQRRTR